MFIKYSSSEALKADNEVDSLMMQGILLNSIGPMEEKE